MSKLRLNINTASADNSAPVQSNESAATPSLKLTFNKRPSLSASSQHAAPASASRAKKATGKKASAAPKKRSRQDDDEPLGGDLTTTKKQRTNPKTITIPQSLHSPNLVKLTSAKTPQTPASASLPRLRIKAKAKPFHRPLGVGYDSEAEDAEDDPAIEENLILRMIPGDDCDYVREAIEKKTLGLPTTQGGADITMRFFQQEPRRAALTVRGRSYAAVLVDLPCIVESMKSWDRRGWWKSADICQMLLVTGLVASEEEAQSAPCPRELDAKTWQWPHGLTPPMHNVRKRRFRQRVSHRTIEAAEDEVEKQLKLDEQARQQGGRTEAEVIDLNALQDAEMDLSDGSGPGEDDGMEDVEGDAEGDLDPNAEDFAMAEDYDEEEKEAIAARMALELGTDNDEDTAAATGDVASLPNAQPERQTTGGIPHDESRNSNSAEESNEDDDDEEDEDDNEEEGAEEEDEEQAQMLAQQREEANHLRQEIVKKKAELKGLTNDHIRKKAMFRLESLKKDLANKRRNLGEDSDEDED